MMAPKGKYAYFDWLIFTQVHEIFETEHGSYRRAEEECDLINSLLNDMVDAGFDPVDVYSKRFTSKADEVREIVAKYREKWESIVKESETKARKE